MTPARPLLIVAGAGQGTGRALTREAVAKGYAVAGLSRTEADLESLRDELGSAGQYFSAHAVDLCDAGACENALQAILTSGMTVRALVHCAATWTGGRSVMDTSADDFRRSFDLNFFTALNVIHPVLAHWQARGRTGDLAVVALGATASTRGGKRMSPFATAKGALRTLMQSLAKELGPEGVHVAHVIIDGLIDNPRTRQLNPNTAVDRFIAPESIARLVLGLVEQTRDCWTFEADMRPCNEPW